jgi:hypothetical protein
VSPDDRQAKILAANDAKCVVDAVRGFGGAIRKIRG